MFKDWTIEQIKQTLNSEDKYFLTIDNDVCTYYNHEIADSFDLYILMVVLNYSYLPDLKISM